MNKMIKCLAAGMLALSLAGCGQKSVSELIGSNSNSKSDAETGSSSAGDSSSSGVIYAQDGYADGNLGDTLGTAWCTFRVNSAKLADSYDGGIAPDEGETLLIVNVTLENTTEDDVPMFDADFQAQWNSTGDEDYRYPVTLNGENAAAGNMLPEEYSIPVGESMTGDLVFSVPQGFTDFSLSFMEYYDNEETGDTFFVYFTAN